MGATKRSESALDVVVIGAGAVGCAVAKRFASLGQSVLVLEKEERECTGISSRNSGVIHAGLYYPPDSLKARLCIEGAEKLYEWCGQFGVPHRRNGKLIIAIDRNDEGDLSWLFENAKASGAKGLTWLSRHQLSKYEGFSFHSALSSSATGIVDPSALVSSFRSRAETLGAQFVFNARVIDLREISDGFEIETTRGPIRATRVINCAGLSADVLGESLGVRDVIYPWRGDYFALQRKWPTECLIYPAKKKSSPGLGVHLTIEMDGRQRLGPDVKLSEGRENFGPPPNLGELRQTFFESAARFMKGLRIDDLEYDTCGIRPKLRSPSDSAELDFKIIERPAGCIHLLGIESPGLTAALAIAEIIKV